MPHGKVKPKIHGLKQQVANVRASQAYDTITLTDQLDSLSRRNNSLSGRRSSSDDCDTVENTSE